MGSYGFAGVDDGIGSKVATVSNGNVPEHAAAWSHLGKIGHVGVVPDGALVVDDDVVADGGSRGDV